MDTPSSIIVNDNRHCTPLPTYRYAWLGVLYDSLILNDIRKEARSFSQLQPTLASPTDD